MKEAAVKAQVKKHLDAAGVYWFMPATHGYGTSGLFDVVACVDGVFFGIECKVSARALPTALQFRNALTAKTSGAVVLCIHADNMDALKYAIDEVKNGRRERLDGLCVWPADSAASFAETNPAQELGVRVRVREQKSGGAG